MNRYWKAIHKIIDAPTDDFTTLVEIAGLNPKTDFQYSDLSKVDFGAADLTDYSFRGADLSGANLFQAKLKNVNLDEVIWNSLPVRHKPIVGALEELPYAGQVRYLGVVHVDRHSLQL